jgi:hypothetical protein
MEHGTAADLLALKMEQEASIIERFLYPNGYSQMVGEGGIGKTRSLAHAGVLLASEGDGEWLGLHVLGGQRVGLLMTEGHVQPMKEFLQSLVDLLGEEWTHRLVVRVPGFGAQRFWDLTDDLVRSWTKEWIENDRLDVLIADPFTHLKDPNLKEADGGDMSVVTRAIGEIRDDTGVAIVAAHHPPYARQGGRGSAVLRNELDAEIFLRGRGSPEQYTRPGGLVDCTWSKPPRNDVPPNARVLQRQQNGLLMLIDDAAAGSKKKAVESHVLAVVEKTGPILLPDLETAMAGTGFPCSSREVLRRTVVRLAQERRLSYEAKQGKAGLVSPIASPPHLHHPTSSAVEPERTEGIAT